MTTLVREITQQDYDKANDKGIFSIINEDILLGYGVNKPEVYQENEKYYLKFYPKQYTRMEILY